MVIGIVLGLLFAALMCGGAAVAITGAVSNSVHSEPGISRYEEEAEKNRKLGNYKKLRMRNRIFKIVGACIAVIFLFLLFFIPGSFKTVEAGEVAVVKNLGKISGVRKEGTYFDFWITNKYDTYDAKVQTIDIQDSAYSKDAQTMDIQMTLQYSIKIEEVERISREYGSLDALTNRIRSVAIEKTKGVLSTHKAMNDEKEANGIIENREVVGKEVKEAVSEALKDYYVNVATVALTNIDFTDAFEKTVEEKMIAEQQKLQAEYEKEKAKIEAEAAAQVAKIKAEADLEVAKNKAKAKLEEAKGNADAQREIARAEAYEAQKKIAELARSLGYTVVEEENEIIIIWDVEGSTPEKIESDKKIILEYIKYLEYLKQWNGELPDVIAGDSANILIPTIPNNPNP